MTDLTIDFKRAFEALPGNCLIIEPNAPLFPIAAVSDGHLALTGRKQEDLIGKSVFQVYPDNPQEEVLKSASILRQSLQKVVQTKLPDNLPILRYDVANLEGIFEERYWVPSNKPVLDNKNNVLFILHYVTEVTDKVLKEKNEREEKERLMNASDSTWQEVTLRKLEESESKFRNMVQQAPVAILLTKGRDLVIESINQPMLHLMGKEKPESVIDKKLLDVFPDLANEAVYGIVLKVFETGENFKGNEVPITYSREGKTEHVYFNVAYTPLIEEGVITGVLHVVIDVTEQVLSRKKLEESEQQLKSVIESSPYPIGVYAGKEMKILFANKAQKDGLGKGDNIIGKSFKELMRELESQDVFKQLDDVFETGQPLHVSNRKIDVLVDGKLQSNYYNYSHIPLFNSAGQVYGIVQTAVNVTDIVQSRNKLEESEQQLRSIIESSAYPIGVYVGKEMKILFANMALKEALKKGHDIIGKSFKELMWELESQGVFQQLDHVFNTGEPVHLRNQRIDVMVEGKFLTRYYNYSYTPLFNASGEVYGLVNTAVDVTDIILAQQEIKESEARFRSLANDVPIFIFMSESDIHVSFFNKTWLEYTGQSYEEAVGRRWEKVTPPEFLDTITKVYTEAFKSRTPYTFEAKHRRKDGEYRWVLWTGKPRFLPNGDFNGFMGIG